MKKTYTKEQITEAIAYWEKQLKKMNESNEDMYEKIHEIMKDEFDLEWVDIKDMGKHIAYSYGPIDKADEDALLDKIQERLYKFDVSVYTANVPRCGLCIKVLGEL